MHLSHDMIVRKVDDFSARGKLRNDILEANDLSCCEPLVVLEAIK